MNLAQRVAATEKTLARYRKKAWDWDGATCIHLARYHARNMGHQVPAMPRVRSAVGAKRALKALGHETIEGLLDSLFERIPAARMLVGDLAMLPGEDAGGLGAVVIYDGLAKLIGWHGADPSGLKPIARVAAEQLTGAWRL